MEYNIFGSSSSQDYDIMVRVPEVPKNKELCKTLCQAYETVLKDFYMDKDINVNICDVLIDEDDNTYIADVFKGTPDECNNSVLSTYLLHKQSCQLLVTKSVERNIPLKIARATRIILTFLSRTPFRAQIKQALKEKNFHTQYTILNNFNFDAVSASDLAAKNLSMYDFKKKTAFQFCQVLGLLEGVEIYDKLDCYKMYGVPIWSNDIDLTALKELFFENFNKADIDWDLIKE